MSTAQWLSTTIVLIYAAMFLLFSRIFYLRRYANQNYYLKRPRGLTPRDIEQLAAEQSRDLPRFSIFIPARNEADVIEKTIDHMARLHYSTDHYEVLVVTDEKEAIAAQAERTAITHHLISLLTGSAEWLGGEKEEATLAAVLSGLAVEEADLAELHGLTQQQQARGLYQIVQAVLKSEGRAEQERLTTGLHRIAPGLKSGDILRLYPAFLALTFPVIDQLMRLTRQTDAALMNRLLTQAARARKPLTRKVLANLTDTVAHRMTRALRRKSPEQLQQRITEAYALALPTTQEIVERKRMEFAAHRDLPALRHIEVPYDFDGLLGGECTGHEVPSTKGRALNWAFRFADPRNEVWAFYDAESRPDLDVLLYVTWRRLTVGDKFQIAQGPVYQIRNFWETGPISKIAGIFQAVSHEWQMPWLLRQIPFIGGTNIYATRDLIMRIGGFDDTVLTEDMELGARAWLKGDAWPEFLPYASSEQTPPTYKAFFRQRLRWGAGYLQVYDKIKADLTLPADKKEYLLRIYWWKGHFSWAFFQLIALLPVVVIPLQLGGMIDLTALPEWIGTAVLTFSPIYLLFVLSCFFHYRKHMDPAPRTIQTAGFAQMFLLPISAFFLPFPYSASLLLKLIGRAPKAWVKTPRTKE